MPTIKITKSVIDSFPVTVKETVYWDAGLPGFGVKVTPKGKRVFIVLYRTGWGWLAVAQIHDWALRPGNPRHGAGPSSEDFRGASRWPGPCH